MKMLTTFEQALGWPLWIQWLILAAVIVIVELIHPRWILIWFSAGALVSAAVSIFRPDDLPLQLAVFLGSSLALMLTARPITYHLLFKRHGEQPTNAAAIIGREELCIEPIDNTQGRGAVRVYGSAWHAVSSSDDVKIAAGERVRITAIRDLDLIVEPVACEVESETAADGA